VDRDALDSEDVLVSRPAWATVSTRILQVKDRFTIWDPREERCSVENAAEELAKRESPTKRRVLVIDSVQARDGWACDAEGDDSPRSRIDRRVAVAGRLARSYGLAVVLVSELSRAGYRSKDSADEVNPLATLKESGGLEYAADQVLILSRVEGEVPRIDLLVAKTRWGSTGESVRLRRDGWLTYAEEQRAAEERSQRGQRDRSDEVDAAVLAWIAAHPGEVTRTIEASIKGWSKTATSNALARLEVDGRVRVQAGARGAKSYFVAEAEK
jgi:uncharacterized membrane protein